MSSRKAICVIIITMTLASSALIFFTRRVGAQLNPITILARDACDPVTFDAAVRPGDCVAGEHGTTPFLLFIAELRTDHIAGAWRFNPLLDASNF